MNKPLLVLGFLLIIGITSAHYRPIIKLNPLQPVTSFKQKLPQNRMPNTLALIALNKMQVLKGNNGEGFDLYESTFDGMTIASPDKSQVYSIPNGLQKSNLLLIPNPSDFNTSNLQTNIPKPFNDTFYIPPFNTKKFNPKTEYKK